MDDPQMNAPSAEQQTALYDQPSVDVIAGDELELLSDRELLLYIARNMITAESLVTEMQRKLPEVLEALAPYADNPIVKAALRFLG